MECQNGQALPYLEFWKRFQTPLEQFFLSPRWGFSCYMTFIFAIITHVFSGLHDIYCIMLICVYSCVFMCMYMVVFHSGLVFQSLKSTIMCFSLILFSPETPEFNEKNNQKIKNNDKWRLKISFSLFSSIFWLWMLVNFHYYVSIYIFSWFIFDFNCFYIRLKFFGILLE